MYLNFSRSPELIVADMTHFLKSFLELHLSIDCDEKGSWV